MPFTRATYFVFLLLCSWVVMLMTHEMGHIVGGYCCGGQLKDYDLAPWRMPYSLFAPDPNPLITLWSGPVLGACVPLLFAVCIDRAWSWFIAWFCCLANGVYLALAWFTGDHYLDTPRLLEQGAHPATIGFYCLATIGFGYIGFRRSCIKLLFTQGCPDKCNPLKTVR